MHNKTKKETRRGFASVLLTYQPHLQRFCDVFCWRFLGQIQKSFQQIWHQWPQKTQLIIVDGLQEKPGCTRGTINPEQKEGVGVSKR
jgi:hypothetical protein